MMGTNYYWHPDKRCDTCGRDGAHRIHIGKSSHGWCFSLHVGDYDDEPRSFGAWVEAFAKPGSQIVDEYGELIDADEMIKIITDRPSFEGVWTMDNLQANDARLGPRGLAMGRDERGPDNPEHTYRYVKGYFS